MIPIPKDQLRQRREDIFQQVKKERRRVKQLQALTVITVFVISFLFAVRISPTIASYAGKIPGLGVIVELVQENKGIDDAINHNYYEELGIMQQQGDVTVTLHGAIIDEYGIMLMYDFDYLMGKLDHNNYKVEIYQGNQRLEHTVSYGTEANNDRAISHSSHLLEMTLSEPLDIHNPHFRLELILLDGQQQTISIPFTLQQPIAAAKVSELNTELIVQGQRMVFTKIIRTPLRTQIEVQPDPTNKMQVVALDNISLSLSNGEKRELIRRGLVNSGTLREGIYTLYVQSNYFYEASALTLHIDAVHALPKGEDYIEVDFATKEVLQQPTGIDWGIQVGDHSVTVDIASNDMMKSQPLFPAEKADGTMLEILSIQSYGQDGYQYTTIFEPYDGKARLWINDIDHPIATDVDLELNLMP